VTLATIITLSDFKDLADAAFQAETPTVTSAESELGQALEHFADPAAMRAKAAECARSGIAQYAFGLWYPSMKGRTFERKITLDPPRDGHSFRHSLSGWGVIRLQLYFTPPYTLQCRVVVNSQTRAQSREARYPELGAVADWDWRVVETLAFRLSRRLAAMGKTAPVVQSAPDA